MMSYLLSNTDKSTQKSRLNVEKMNMNLIFLRDPVHALNAIEFTFFLLDFLKISLKFLFVNEHIQHTNTRLQRQECNVFRQTYYSAHRKYVYSVIWKSK